MGDVKTEVTIRRAQKKDIERITELLRQVNQIHYERRNDIFKNAPKHSEEELVTIINSDMPVFVAVDRNDNVLGHAFCEFEQVVGNPLFTDAVSLHLDDLCIDENYRGQGIGTALYEHIREFAVSKGIRHITLNVYELNKEAKEYYKKLGLTPLKTTMEEYL